MPLDAIQDEIRKAICKGCFTYSNCDLQCSIKPITNGIRCPCSTCIIKMMCNEPCDKLHQYRGGYYIDKANIKPKIRSSGLNKLEI